MKPSIWFWVVGIFALFFEGFGVIQFIRSVTDIEGAVSGMTPEQAAYFMELPAWRNVLFGVGTLSGLAAALLFLLRRGVAVILFLIGVPVYTLGWLASFFDGGFDLLGAALVVQGLVFIAILSFFWWYARKQKADGVLV